MKEIGHWPSRSDLDIQETTYLHLITLLSAPFNNEQEAQQFWADGYCCLVMLDDNDDLKSLSDQPELVRRKIQRALQYPEEQHQLACYYRLDLSITSDDGSGVYLLMTPDCPLAVEVDDD
tara:strand:- start:2210 stop:2569 length:360 start_codon:yes stop_codon:yes gene_type:complete